VTLTETPPTNHQPDPHARAAAMPAEHLEAQIVTLTRRLSSGTYDLLVLVGELDARGTWATWGALSCAAWLADACDLDIATARTHVRVARALRTHPALDHAMRNGDVSFAKARVLVAYLSEDNANDLVRIAATTPSGRLGQAIAAWLQRNEHPDDTEHRLHEARSASWRTDPDGLVTLTIRLHPAIAGRVCATIDHRVTTANAPAGASLAQQRADATTHLILDTTGNGGSGPGGGTTTELVVHVTQDGNHLPDGTPLTDHAVTALLPHAFISLLIHDAKRWPIDASPRRRNPTPRQRRVLEARHPPGQPAQCAHPGCTATTFLQADHIHPYTQGGPTTLDNLQLLCGTHNRQRWQQRGEP
jgi:hypothetical protein